MSPDNSTQLTSPVTVSQTVDLRRRAFTVVELLVVMGIIAIMMTLVLGVVGAFLSQARDAATKTTINKIQGLLNSRMQAFDRRYNAQLHSSQSTFLTSSQEYQNVQSAYPKLPASTQKILATKLLEAKFFPQNVADLTNTQAANFYTKAAGIPSIYNNSSATNAEILYDFLTQSNALGATPVNQDAFSASEVQDIDIDGLPQFVDAWGTEIRFYRWPTRLFCSAGQTATDAYGNTVPAAITAADIVNARLLFSSLPVFSGNLQNDLARDPDDPLRECIYNFQPGPGGYGIFENLTYSSIKFHTPATYYVMLIVSAGPDQKFGMYAADYIDPNGVIRGDLGQVQDPKALVDDIISLNIRAGGK